MKIPLVLCTVFLCVSSNNVMSLATEASQLVVNKQDVTDATISPNLIAAMVVELQTNTVMSPVPPIVLDVATPVVNRSFTSSTPGLMQKNESSSDLEDDAPLAMQGRGLSQSFHNLRAPSVVSAIISDGLNATPSTGCLVSLMEQRKQVSNAPHNATPPSPMKKVNGICPHAQPAQDHGSSTPSPVGKKHAQPGQDHVSTTPSPINKQRALVQEEVTMPENDHVSTTPSPIRKPSPDKK